MESRWLGFALQLQPGLGSLWRDFPQYGGRPFPFLEPLKSGRLLSSLSREPWCRAVKQDYLTDRDLFARLVLFRLRFFPPKPELFHPIDQSLPAEV